MATAVGIDLGTTNSVIAATEGGKPTVIPNAEGSRTTPSVVAFTTQGERLVGQLARRQAILNPKGTIYSAKRFIGRHYDEVTSEQGAVSFDVVPGPDGTARFEIQGRQYAPEEISALVLRKLVEDASKFLGEKITEAVITVPPTSTTPSARRPRTRAGSPAWRSCGSSTSPRPRPWLTAWTRRRARRSWSMTWAAVPST
jgi:molecular chaperone DnaK